MELIGVDTTFLVEAIVRESPRHALARRYLNQQIVGGAAQLAISPQVLSEFIHVVSDPRRFERPLTMAQARGHASFWWRAKEVRNVFPSAATGQRFLEWLKEHRLGRKRLLDTMLAATYQTNGISRILSTNARDFGIFGCFEVIIP